MENSGVAQLRTAIRQNIQTSRDQRFCYRALCVLLIKAGHKPKQVADWLGEHTRTLERWRKRYEEKGLDGLVDETSPGRPPKLSPNTLDTLEHDLRKSPKDFGFSGTKWQGKSLQQHLQTNYQVNFSLRQCQRLLKQYRQRDSQSLKKGSQKLATVQHSPSPS